MPTYDRMAAVRRIKSCMPEDVEWVHDECRDISLVLVITGCKVACADVSAFRGMSIRFITCEDDVERFIDEVC